MCYILVHFIIIIIIIIIIIAVPQHVKAEDSRFLVYTNGGVFKFVLGWGIPVHVPMSVIFAHNIQFQYMPVDNYTEVQALIQNGVFRSLKLTKHHIYTILEQVMQRENYQSDCLLWIICELAKTPIFNSGILGDILQILFTPEENKSKYGMAWNLGHSHKNCSSIFCPFGSYFLQRISKIHYI